MTVTYGSKYTRTYRHSESKVLNVSYEPPDNWKRLGNIFISTLCMQYGVQLQVHILRQPNNKEYVINCWYKYLSRCRHSETKVFNVSYLPPDNIKDFQIHWDPRNTCNMM